MALQIFRSPRLIFTPIEQNDEHADMLQELRSEAEYTSSGPYLPRPGGKEAAQALRRSHADDRLALFICLYHEDGVHTPIGTLSLSKLGSDDLVHHSQGSIGIVLLRKYHRKGYGTEALQWMMWYGFEVAHLHRLGLFCGGWNKGAQRLYEKIGFVAESRQREALWMLGVWHDRMGYGILGREWQALGNRWLPHVGEIGTSNDVAKLLNCE